MCLYYKNFLNTDTMRLCYNAARDATSKGTQVIRTYALTEKSKYVVWFSALRAFPRMIQRLGEIRWRSGVLSTDLDFLYCHSTSLKRSRLMTASNLDYNGLSYETEVYLNKHSSPLEDASVVEKGKKDE